MKHLSLLAMQMLYHKFNFSSSLKYAGKIWTIPFFNMLIFKLYVGSEIVLVYSIPTSSSNKEDLHIRVSAASIK